jgi:SH3-like domain-containing protein
MTSTIQIEQVRVRGTGSSGLFLRKEPERADNVLRTLPDGAILQVVGANRTVGDVVWRNVRDDAGNEGWVSAAFLETVE